MANIPQCNRPLRDHFSFVPISMVVDLVTVDPHIKSDYSRVFPLEVLAMKTEKQKIKLKELKIKTFEIIERRGDIIELRISKRAQL